MSAISASRAGYTELPTFSMDVGVVEVEYPRSETLFERFTSGAVRQL